MTDFSGSTADLGDLPAFEAFLSHRYASAQVNLYFYRIFKQLGQVQFQVDEGPQTISMTRLARMVRHADAFIGIYPLPESPTERVTARQLRSASRYFRLELELATRARKPMAVFYDERFRAHLDLPTGIYQQAYDPQEILSAGSTPSERRHLLAFASFAISVQKEMQYRAQIESQLLTAPTTIGLLLPPGKQGYPGPLVRQLEDKIEDRGYRTQRLGWPPVLTAELVSLLRQLDWVVIYVADTVPGEATLAFLHGHAIPTLRLYHAADGTKARPRVEQALFGGFEVGYCEDLLSWRDEKGLVDAFTLRLDQIETPVRRISTTEEAETYFQHAQLRKEQVFVSYASQDSWAAHQIAEELRRRFQRVFDYQDGGESLPAGTPWMTELYARLHHSQIGIPVLSSSYVAKQTCMREAEHMMIQSDQGSMKVFPLNADQVEAPPFLQTLQFRPLDRSSFDARRIVGDIIARYDQAAS